MAEPEAPEAGGGGLGKTLGRKIGPLPAGVWIVIAVAVFWYISKRTKAGAGTAAQTDPAGNTGSIDPQTGYVYGTPEDQAALGGGSSSLGTSSDSGTGGSTVAGSYADNQAWAVAAINYLVSIGVDATEANTAINQFLDSQQLTTQQQADVNLVIQRIGAPPSPPSPGGSPGPVVTPPGGGATYASNPPSGFTTTTVSGSAIGAKWNSVTNAASYTMSWGTSPNKADGSATVSTTAATATGLKPNTLYYLRVQANPSKPGAPFATLSKTTAKASGGGGKPPGGTKYDYVTVVKWTKTNPAWNSTLSGIAQHYHVKGGYQELAKLNGIHDPNLIHPGQKIKVPVS
jgi:hypothetical protein